MLQIRNRTAVSALLILLALFVAAALTETGSAANSRQTQNSPSINNSSQPDSIAQNPNEVQVVVSYLSGTEIQQAVSTISSGNRVEKSSNTSAPNQTTAVGDVVFSQVYGSGGNPGSTYQNNFLEIFNRTGHDINISGWTFFIGGPTGNFTVAISFISSQGLFIDAHRYLLIQFGPASSNGAPLPTPDFIVPFHFDPPPGVPPPPDINLSPSGKVLLTASSSSFFGNPCPVPNADIVDFVGYGSTTNCFEGSGPTGTLSNTTAAKRNLDGCIDTDNNAGDFSVVLPTPRNSQSPANNTCTNRIDDTDFFVRQHYADFLNRQPDTPGLNFWKDQINSCGADAQCIEIKRINVSAAFFLSIEFQETGYLVYRTYKAAYGNLTNPPGAPVPVTFQEFLPDQQLIGQGLIVNDPGWEMVLENNKVAFFNSFVGRSRFMTAYPTSLSPADFVDALFGHAGVTPTANERSLAINEFAGAMNTSDQGARARALRRVAENDTLGQQEKHRAFVLMQYFGYLRRNPYDPPEQTLDFQGYNFWLNKLNEHNGNFIEAEMVKSFLVSGEYRARF